MISWYWLQPFREARRVHRFRALIIDAHPAGPSSLFLLGFCEGKMSRPHECQENMSRSESRQPIRSLMWESTRVVQVDKTSTSKIS
jgi:hypothetical protein